MIHEDSICDSGGFDMCEEREAYVIVQRSLCER